MQIPSEYFLKSYYTASYAKDGSRTKYFDPLYLKVNSVTENTSFSSYISVVISIQFRYHLTVISLSINLDMLTMGL